MRPRAVTEEVDVIWKIVHYKVQPDKLARIRRAIEDFVGAIGQSEPQTFYEAYQAEDGRSFVHIMSFPDEATEKFHQSAPHTLRFVEVLYPSCEEAPVFTTLSLVGTTQK